MKFMIGGKTGLKNKIAIGLTASIAVSAMLMPFLAAAQIQSPPQAPVTRIEDLIRVLNTLVNWLFAILMIIAVIFIFYAAYLYLTAGGDPEKVKTATKQLVFAAIAIAVALIAQGVKFVVSQLLGGPTGGF
ncbi:MAG: hypothetical protein HY456_01440 [Parcubacteria group bacterium]|nr:hypothetical protein [Parcubacteria group bacterium]